VSAQRVIGVDLGGTKIAAAVVGEAGEVEHRVELPTPVESQDALIDAIAGVVAEVGGDGYAAVGVGVPSLLDRKTGTVVGSVNIPLRDVPLARVLEEHLGVPVGLENDANLATLAEWRHGAGRGVDELLMLTLGTGVGGGVVTGGRLYRGWAELGHSVVVPDGPPCQGACTGRGHLEAVASGNAADRAAEELWGADANAELLVERAEKGDVDARSALAAMGHLLGIALGSFANVFGSELVVVGGGFGVAAADLLVPSALESLRREALPRSTELEIVTAELGRDAGMIGAGLLAFEALG
jgi:glucokinase